MDSVIVVAAPAVESVRVAADIPAPGTIVVIVCAAPKPLSPLNVKPPAPPTLTFVMVTVAGGTVADAGALSFESAARKSVTLAVLAITAPLAAVALTVC